MNTYRIYFTVDYESVDSVESESDGFTFDTMTRFKNILLPINPQELTITYPANPTNYNVEGIGEVIIPRIPNLATLTIDSFFPREYVFNGLTTDTSWHSPDWYINFFRTLQRSGKVFDLTILRGMEYLNEYTDGNLTNVYDTPYHDTVMKAVVLDFSVTDKGGEPGDVYFTLTLSEYRDASPKVLAEIVEDVYAFDDAFMNETENSAVTDKTQNRIEIERVVINTQREPQQGAIVPGQTVTVNGEVYNSAEESKSKWLFSAQKANRLDRVITRVLPPKMANKVHSMYIDGLGWVDKGNCKLSQNQGIVKSSYRVLTNE